MKKPKRRTERSSTRQKRNTFKPRNHRAKGSKANKLHKAIANPNWKQRVGAYLKKHWKALVDRAKAMVL